MQYPDQFERIWAHNADGWRWVRRGDIPGLLYSLTFADAMRLYMMWKRFGLPNGRGWLHESEGVLQVISIVDEERNLWEVKEQEARMAERGNSGRTKGRRSR